MSEQSNAKRRDTAAPKAQEEKPAYHADVLALIESKVEVGPIERLENFLRAEYETIAGHIGRGHLTITRLAEAVHDSGKFGKPNRQLVSTLWGKIRKEVDANSAKEATPVQAAGKPQEKAATQKRDRAPKKDANTQGTSPQSNEKGSQAVGAEFDKTVGEQQPASTGTEAKADK